MTNSALQPGDRLGTFRVIQRLGAGGMGEVYRAHDDGPLKREVALKVLPLDTRDDATARARLMGEARKAASLSHPNICTVYQVGDDRGREFIAMELIHGESLDQRCRPSGLPVSEVLRLGSDIADALEHAHEHRVIHRDLKTANILLTAEGRVKVMDFGLARRVASADATTVGGREPALTEPGAIAGTPHYLPPEAWLGAQADARSDIWALGVMLHEMATGIMPFDGKTQGEVAGNVLHVAPRPLPESVPAGLRAIITRCLEKAPGRRYQHAGEVRAALEAVALSSTPLPTPLATPPSPGPLQKPARATVSPFPIRHLLGWGVGVLLLALLWKASIVPSGCTPPPIVNALAVLPLENLSRDPSQDIFADGMAEEITTRLAQIASLRIIAQGSIVGLVRNGKSDAEIGKLLGVRLLLRGSVMKVQDRVRISVRLVEAQSSRVRWAGKYERQLVDILGLQSEVALAVTDAIQAVVTPQEHTRLAASSPIDTAAYEAYLKGRSEWNKYTLAGFQESERQFKRAIEIAPNYAPAWAGLADAAYGMSSIFVPANEAIPRARAAAEKALALDSTLSEAHTSIGIVKLVYDWDWAGAEHEFDRAIALRPNDANSHLWRGHLLVMQGRFDDGLAAIRKALDLDPLSSWITANVGWHLYYARRYDEALRQLRAAELSDPENYSLLFVLGLVLEQQGDHAGAIAAFEKKQSLAPNNDNLSQLAHAYATAGRRMDAERLIAQLKQHRAQGFVPAANIAYAYAGIGERDSTFRWLDLGLEDHSENLIWLKVCPAFDLVRSDPRFAEVLRRVNLAP